MERLAIHGGKPVRSTPLAPDYPGAALIGKEEKCSVLEVLDRRSPFRFYGPDPAFKVRAFERAFATTMGTRHALAVNSGTAALIVALEVLGIGVGDEVIVPANTFLASAGAVLRVGATPVYVDIDDTFNLDPSDLPRKLSSHTRALMPVHFEGSSCDMDSIMAFARKHDILVLEDAAQACGATFHGQKVGTIGDAGAFSFQINKMITAGEGGAVTTNSDTIHEKAMRLHDQGGLRTSSGEMSLDDTGRALVGENYRMGELAGAVLVEQLKKLDMIIVQMRRVANAIRESVSELTGASLRRHSDPLGEIGRRVFLTLENSDIARQVEMAMRAENVPVGRLYGGHPVVDHPQLRANDAKCPRARDLLSRTVTLSVSPLWENADIEDISRAFQKVLTHVAKEVKMSRNIEMPRARS